MAFPESALSVAARRLRTLLASSIDDLDEASVLIGTPKQASAIESNLARLNLFFYRVEPAGYPPDALASEPLFVRLRCLVTALAIPTTGGGGAKVSPGENDLRLLGAAILALHREPLLLLPDAEQPVAQLQITLAKVSGEELERLWSAQGSETSYRPSMAYELAMVPIPLEIAKDSRPKTGTIGGSAQQGTTLEDQWTPQLWLETVAGPRQSLVRDVADQQPIEFSIAGQSEAQVTLIWSLLPTDAEDWTELPVGDDPVLDDQGRALVGLEPPFDGTGQALLSCRRLDDPLGPTSTPVLISFIEGEP